MGGESERFSKHIDAEDFVEDVREQFDIITDAVEEIRSLCGIED